MNRSRPASRSVLGRIKTSHPRIQHLLVPLDFSGKSRQALRYTVPLAQKFSARIHLVHVLPLSRHADKDDLIRQRLAALKRLGQMPAELLPRLRAGNAVLTGLGRVLVGSTAEHLMRHAPCLAISVRPG